MTYWTLTEADIDRIAIGVGILGTGGGGSPYLQMLAAKQMLAQGHRIRMIRPQDLADDAQVIGLGGIGAPTVSVEKMEEGGEGERVLRAIEASSRDQSARNSHPSALGRNRGLFGRLKPISLVLDYVLYTLVRRCLATYRLAGRGLISPSSASWRQHFEAVGPEAAEDWLGGSEVCDDGGVGCSARLGRARDAVHQSRPRIEYRDGFLRRLSALFGP